MAQLVAHMTGGHGAAGSSPVTPTTSEQSPLCSDLFFSKISHPPASLLLLFREKSRSVCLLVCKRTRDGSLSLPTFHDIAPSPQPKSPAALMTANSSSIALFAYPINDAASTIDNVKVYNCQYDITVYSKGTVTVTNSNIEKIETIADGATLTIDGVPQS